MEWIGANMNNTLFAITALLATFCTGTAHAQSPRYAGVAAGQSTGTNISEGEVNDLLRARGYNNAATRADKKDNFYRLTLGYQLSPNVAVEAMYADIGQFGTRSTVTGGSVNADYKASGYGIDLVLAAPVAQDVSLFVRAGVLRAKTEARFGSSGAVVLTFNQGSSTKTGNHFGAGLQYEISRNVALRFEAERFSKLGDDSTGGELKADAYSIGALIRF
jgi:OOP family OmpA-OmpF porin